MLAVVTAANPLFDFALSLQKFIDCDRLDYLSPPASPQCSPALVPTDELEGLSSLTAPGPLANSPPTTSWLETLPPNLGPFATSASFPIFLPSTFNSVPLPSSTTIPEQGSKSTQQKPSKKPAHCKDRQYAIQKAWRQGHREKQRDAISSHYKARKNTYLKHVQPAETIECSWDASEAEVSSTAFVGARETRGSKKQYSLEELVGENSRFKFRKVEWNGSTPTAIIDAKKCIVGILAGRPDEKIWPALQSEAAAALKTRRKRCRIPKMCRKHRRGAFVALNCGVSHGGGQKAPGNLRNDSPNAQILEELNGMEPFKRLAGFSSSVMATWAPKLHEYYSQTIDALHSDNSTLKRIFSSSVFSAATYNFGPKTVCFEHTDPGNLAFGACSVTPLGDFDPTQGGHLILWDLHLVIEFPPGSTILFPSAIVAHSNVKIADHEKCYSFAQYTSGALFRWVDNKCMTRKNYLSSLSAQELEDNRARNAARWQYGLSLIPVYTSPEKKADEVES